MSSMLVALLAAGAVGETEIQAAAPEYRHSSFGVLSTLGIGSGLEGDHLAGELGLQLFGLRAFDRRWLVYWDAALAMKLGGLANQHPYFFFGGGVARATAELGRRLLPEQDWSAYLSLRGAGSVSVLGTPGLSLSGLNTLNNSDGFGGVTAGALARASLGASYLSGGGHASFVLALFFQESLRAPRTNTPGRAFSEVGLSARLDLEESFTLAVEAVLGTTPQVGDAALHATTQTSHVEASGFLRKTFHNGVWLGLAASFGRDTARVVYEGGGAFDTARPPDFAVTASLGLPVGVKP
jgi:hypothetical protein